MARWEQTFYMKGMGKYLFIVLALLYLISPYDILPDLIPGLGHIDDLSLLGILFYYLWRGRLPWTGKNRPAGTETNKKTDSFDQGAQNGRAGVNSKNGDFDPYRILEISPDAGPEEIKSAHRNRSQKYHPDKVAHLGNEFQELAQKKFVEIQKAYEELCRRGRC